MTYSYNFENKKRDLTDQLSTVISTSSNIMRLFPVKREAIQRKHEWLEDQITGKRCKITGAVSDLACPMSAADLAKLRIGTLVSIDGDNGIYRVADKSGSAATLALVGANGSSKTTPANGDSLIVVSTPEPEGSTEGTKFFHQSGTNFNYSQIFRKDIILTGTAIAISTYGIENQMNYQTRLALMEMARDMSLTALRGVPQVANETQHGALGGLFYFATLEGSLGINVGGNAFDSFVVNDGAQVVSAEGGTPTVIICGIGQARVLSADMNDKVIIQQQDPERGTYVATVINDVTGRMMTIFADPEIPDDQAFIVDPSGFGLVPLKGRSLSDEDTTPKGFDGRRRTALGEYTLEFKNPKQRICRAYGLKDSAEVLAEKRDKVAKVQIIGGELP